MYLPVNQLFHSGLLENKNSSRLEDDAFCGIATGGKENCEWDCIPSFSKQGLYLNPECMLDCFNRDHCAVKALNEFIKAEGICKSCSTCEIYHNILPTTSKECEYIQKDLMLNSNLTVSITFTPKGIFSEDTIELLTRNESCIFDVHRKSPSIYNTMQVIVTTSSNLEANQFWTYFLARHVAGLKESDFIELLPLSLNRFQPGLR